MKKIAISLFDYSGVMMIPWLENNYDCYLIDIKHNNTKEKYKNATLYKIKYDLKHTFIHNLNIKQIKFISCFPPCDDVAASGSRWFKGKGLRKLADSIHCFATAAEFCESTNAPYLIENPVSTISTYWRKPNYTFHPYYFTRFNKQDNYSKLTCLWTGNNFNMPKQNKDDSLTIDNERILNAPIERKQRREFRNITPLGFAHAVYQANK